MDLVKRLPQLFPYTKQGYQQLSLCFGPFSIVLGVKLIKGTVPGLGYEGGSSGSGMWVYGLD
jgi:hypothetical protein